MRRRGRSGSRPVALGRDACAVIVLALAASQLAFVPRPAGAETPARKPGLAFLLSALLPGSGQLYNGDRRGYIYLGAEAGCWFARLSYSHAGKEEEDASTAYAGRHWATDRYRGAAGDPGCTWSAAADSALADMYENSRTRYYDTIGQVDDYRCGWDDFASTYDPAQADAKSPNRAHYVDMRQKSSDLKGNAKTVLGLMIINRLISSVDAYRTARNRNQKESFHLESGMDGSIDRPRLTVRLVRVIP